MTADSVIVLLREPPPDQHPLDWFAGNVQPRLASLPLAQSTVAWSLTASYHCNARHCG